MYIHACMHDGNNHYILYFVIFQQTLVTFKTELNKRLPRYVYTLEVHMYRILKHFLVSYKQKLVFMLVFITEYPSINELCMYVMKVGECSTVLTSWIPSGYSYH